MRVLVTGGAGFIGSHIARALQGAAATVRVLDDFSSGRTENLPAVNPTSGAPGIEIIEGDIRVPGVVERAVRDVELIFHEAAFVSVPASMEDPQQCFDVNVGGTSLLLEAARKAGVRRVVLASSAAIYGDSREMPLHEDSRPQPQSPYAASKLVDEIYADLYTRSLGMEVCALRYFNVFGPRQRPDTPYAAAVPIFIGQLREKRAPTIFGDGGQARDLIFVADVARANILAAESKAAPGQVLNVCTGRKTRILDLVEALYRLLPGAPPPTFGAARSGDIYESVGSPVKAKAVLGFEAQTSLEQGLEETLREWSE